MEAMKQLEEQKAQANIEEAGRKGYETEQMRLGAYQGEQQ